MMEKIIDELVAQNCDKALTECKDYIEKEYSGKYSEEELRPIAEKVIYKRAVADTFKMLHYFNLI